MCRGAAVDESCNQPSAMPRPGDEIKSTGIAWQELRHMPRTQCLPHDMEGGALSRWLAETKRL